ncbi:hypothetical protein ACH4U6_35580 [Streptomyces netropsis]|uniref:hypothetical protein n=1 Tax=Streptomyces netropsis TaxID=55404 RepID=UPI00378763F3
MPLVEMCGRADDREWCDRLATDFDYGMARCDQHEIDLSPCSWEGNTREGFCCIDHTQRGHIYGPTCRNPRP